MACELSMRRVAFWPTTASKPRVGASLKRSTRSCASISAPYRSRSRPPDDPTSAHERAPVTGSPRRARMAADDCHTDGSKPASSGAPCSVHRRSCKQALLRSSDSCLGGSCLCAAESLGDMLRAPSQARKLASCWRGLSSARCGTGSLLRRR
eukprot:scaffold43337_cov69-Phaeocystis_antarctica.AAC.2